MPLSPPLTEEEKAFQPILHTFLAHANTQGLHSIVDKHGRETEAVGKDLAALREAFNTLQSQRNEDHQRIIELQSKVEKLQGANEELRTTNGELRGVNEEIRLSNEKLRHDNGKLPIVSDKAVETVNALEKKVDLALNNFVDKLETAIGHTRTATQDLRSRFDQLHGDTQALQNIQKQMRMYDDRLGDTEFRQQNVEEVVEKLANMVNGMNIVNPFLVMLMWMLDLHLISFPNLTGVAARTTARSVSRLPYAVESYFSETPLHV